MEVAGKSLLSHALERASLVSSEAFIVTNQEHYYFTESLCKSTDENLDISFLLEPQGRNTAPAIALAVRQIQTEFGDDTTCLVLAADHLISDDIAFQKVVEHGVEQAQAGNLVVFGVRPTSPETGYGYLEVAARSDEPQPLKRFVEKPDHSSAKEFLADGRYYWNSGMFCFTAGVMAKNIALHAPDVWAASETVFANAVQEGAIIRFNEDSFANLPDISIDYAVLEKAGKISMVPAGFGWSDIGSWDAVAQIHESDESGNSAIGTKALYLIDACNTHVESTSYIDKVIAAIGVDNMVIIDTPDALLVADRNKSQQVKTVVEELKNGDMAKFSKLPSIVNRPWGTYATLKQEGCYQVKRLVVSPSQKLSLQYHHHRAEHWIVTQGRAMVQIGDNEYETGPGEHRYIPIGEKHRLTNIGDSDLILIEVQIGDYLGEDDIVRLEDIYGR